MKILMILTSHATLGATGKPTGFWLEEFAAPYYAFLDSGADITLASPLGGQPPLDPKSDEPDAQTDATRRFSNDAQAQAVLASTQRLADMKAASFDAVFFPGGHGPLWDLAENGYVMALIRDFYASGKIVSAVCHAPAVFRHVKTAEGTYLVKDKNVTGFSNTEEAAVGLTDVVPFLVEDMLKDHGAHYTRGDDWQPHIVIDGRLITGQNPASSIGVADAVIGQWQKSQS
ncbi:type 1 glutamine amidotransferase domain-containing protein [Advenella mimigardefordensis]|uniref:Putative transcriptional regulator, DJ-1/PfpI family n=1 Tax=Advenella mimigardefordensis (strain DSM 17166 / LMG 22922 / DPN7) TaxID=1247726 RepID=W0PGX2_ADVMD|nr:type 1 glutamine amidotransferase domain-containing protein [Advenella mimigardefordensis]AHG65691.1 putative transcriptional regulator, DJ-1/PfpI family [Advenella mimigardefordensis DPN7]